MFDKMKQRRFIVFLMNYVKQHLWSIVFLCSHDNWTGRWLSKFRAVWHPRREDVLIVGSMKRPRQVTVITAPCFDFLCKSDILENV